MTSSEVPTASGIVKPSARTRAGTITKPPPTPKKPVSSPTIVPATVTFTMVIGSIRDDGAVAARRCRADRPSRGGAARPRVSPDAAPHRVGRDQHEPGEGEQQHVGVGGLVPVRAEQRAADAGEAEHEAGAEPHSPGAPVRHDADHRGHGDEDERRRRGVLGRLPGGVDERRDGEDRAAATERAERQADEEAER